jgi:UDPglucose 6-dehydrogenase
MLSDLYYLEPRDCNNHRKLIQVHNNPYEAISGAHAVAVLTGWEEFKDYNWKKIYSLMKKPAFIFDGRNILDKEKLEEIGFVFYSIGK